MKQNYLVVLSRGFIGVATPGLNREVNQQTTVGAIIDMRYNNPQKVEDPNQVFNTNIVKMHRAMIHQTLSRDKLVFLRGMIIEALRVFGTGDLFTWIDLQKNSRYFTRNHQNFILDTLHYIETGERKTSINTWEIVLKRRLIDDLDSVVRHPTYEADVQKFFRNMSDDNRVIGSNLTKIIPKWLSHRGGAEDMMTTLNLIFGKEHQ